MAVLYTNNAVSMLASAITSGATSLTVTAGQGAKFPTPSGGDFFYATLVSSSSTEIVKVTARSTDTFTIVRAQEGTTAAAFAAGDAVSLFVTAGFIDQLKLDIYAAPATLTNKTIQGYTETVVTANTSTAYTINIANGTVQKLTLTGNCTYTFPTATAGQSFILYQLQDATGSRTVTWPTAVKWPSGTAPTLTSTASKADVFAFTADGTNWIGRTIGQAYL